MFGGAVNLSDSFIGYANEHFQIPSCYQGDLDCVLIPEGMIKDRIERLAEEIQAVIGDGPLVALCVLKGSFKFFTALTDKLYDFRLRTAQPIMFEFIRLR